MESMKVTVIGGFKKESLEKKAKLAGDIDIAFHDGKLKHKNPERVIEQLVKRSDYVVLMVDACSHQSMWDTKKAAKKHNVPVHFQKGLGVSSAIASVVEHIHSRLQHEEGKFFLAHNYKKIRNTF